MIPQDCRWPVLRDLQSEELTRRYSAILDRLSRLSGVFDTIFLKAQNEIQDPAKLRRLVGLIDGETWLGLGVDVKGSIYEGLLERNAQEVKSGAGQYFTPRADRCDGDGGRPRNLRKQSTILPAAPAGFCLRPGSTCASSPGAQSRSLYADGIAALGDRHHAEIVRLCAMNLYLRGIADRQCRVEARHPLLGDGGRTYEVVLTNPPLGKEQSYRIVRDEGEIDTEGEDYDCQDFFVTTSHKQLNFQQHIMTVLAESGRAGVVILDNVLFEGGAGETIRRRLLHNFDFHTLLRLSTGIFYKQGVKANVLFFDKKRVSAEPNTEELRIYDLRTNQRFTLKERPMTRADLDDFVACYKSGRRHERTETDRFRRFAHAEFVARGKVNLDIFWLKDDTLGDPDLLPPPDEIAAEIVENLEASFDRFRKVA